MLRPALSLVVLVTAVTVSQSVCAQDYSLDRFQESPRASSSIGWGLFGGRERTSAPFFRTAPPEVRISRPRFDLAPADQEPATDSDAALGPRAFCVRLCDGFFFPIGPAASGSTERAQGITCANLCPASAVALYSLRQGGEVAEAVGPRGERYASLPVAFQFRERLTPGCSCSGNGAGLSHIPATHDFTLRSGDMIVTEQGAASFTGRGSFPFSSRQFVPLDAGQLRGEIAQRILASRRPSMTPNLEMQARLQTSVAPTKPLEVAAPRPIRVVPLFAATVSKP